MCTYNAISSHTDHFEIQKRDSEENLVKITFVVANSVERDMRGPRTFCRGEFQSD